MKKNKNIFLVIGILVLGVVLAFYIKNTRVKDNNIANTEKPNQSKLEEKKDLAGADKDQNKEKKEVEEAGFYIKSEEEYDKIIKEDKPLILMFGTKVCTYCVQMRPYVEEISGLYQSKVNIRYVDAEDLPNVAYKYPIRGVPAFMIRNNDKTGFNPSEGLLQELTDNFNAPTPYSEGGSDTHDITMTYGLMSKELTIKIVEELIDYAK